MDPRPPLRDLTDLAAADADAISDQVRWELRRLMSLQELTALDVAIAIGYKSSAGAFSSWASQGKSPPADKARALDDTYPDYELSLTGETFSSLQALLAQRKRARIPPPTQYDAFIASPMAAAAKGAFGEERSAAMEVADALERFCGFRNVYYAGKTIESEEDFESPAMSIKINAQALRNSRYFILLILQPPETPSGIYVEAGMALARNIPSIYFVPHTGPEYLPWMLGTIGQHHSKDLPPVSIEQVRSVAEATRRLRAHGRALFRALDERPEV